jgi:hypothetical protein
MIATDRPQRVEVLPHEEYEAERLPGVISIPIGDRLATSMDRDERDLVLVTTLDGRLVGAIRRDDLWRQTSA